MTLFINHARLVVPGERIFATGIHWASGATAREAGGRCRHRRLRTRGPHHVAKSRNPYYAADVVRRKTQGEVRGETCDDR